MTAAGVGWLRARLGLAALLLLTLLVYARSLTGDFVVDDVPVLRDNPYVQQSGHYADYFTRSLWANSALEDSSVPMYRPLFHVYHALSYHLWGGQPFGYHAALLLLHLLNTCLVYGLLRRLAAPSAAAALFGAALFALNPARVESVAWISGITDPLTTLFLLLTLLAHRALADRPRPWLILAALASFQCALWNKEVALAFPLLAVIYDWLYLRRVRWGLAGLYAALALGYLLTRGAVLGQAGGWSLLALPAPARLLDFLLGYAELLTLPLDVPFYLSPPTRAVASLLGGIGLLALFAAAVYGWRGADAAGRRNLLFALAWTGLFAWSALLMAFYDAGYFSARFLYLPAVGVALFAALLFDRLSAALGRLPVAAAGAMLIAGYAVLSWQQSAAWQDDGSIYAKIAQDAPDDAKGYLGLGRFHFDRADYAQAERDFTTALDKRGSRRDQASAYAALGSMRGMAGDLAGSRDQLQQALQLDPANSQAWTGMGNLAWLDGRLLEAIPAYEKALQASPRNYEAAMNLASAYERTGQGWRAAAIRQQWPAGR